MAPANLRYVVTGCAGSGTKWTSMLLSFLGSACGHQTVFRADGVHVRGKYLRKLRGDSSFFATPYTHDLPVLRLVRNPLRVVRSLDQMTGFLDGSGDRDDELTTAYIGRHLPGVKDAQDRLGRLIRYVAQWDGIVSTAEIHTLRIDEAGRDEIADMLWHSAGIEVPRAEVTRTLNRLGRIVNTHGGSASKVTWPMINDHPDGHLLVSKAQRWGYL